MGTGKINSSRGSDGVAPRPQKTVFSNNYAKITRNGTELTIDLKSSLKGSRVMARLTDAHLVLTDKPSKGKETELMKLPLEGAQNVTINGSSGENFIGLINDSNDVSLNADVRDGKDDNKGDTVIIGQGKNTDSGPIKVHTDSLSAPEGADTVHLQAYKGRKETVLVDQSLQGTIWKDKGAKPGTPGGGTSIVIDDGTSKPE